MSRSHNAASGRFGGSPGIEGTFSDLVGRVPDAAIFNPLELSIGRLAIGDTTALREGALELQTATGVSITIPPTIVCRYLESVNLGTIIRDNFDFRGPEDVLDHVLSSAIIDPASSTQRFHPKLFSVETQGRGNGAHRMIARVIDEESGFYPSGFMLTGEKLAVGELFRTDPSITQVKNGEHLATLVIAKINNADQKQATNIRRSLAKLLPTVFDFGPIDLISDIENIQ